MQDKRIITFVSFRISKVFHKVREYLDTNYVVNDERVSSCI